MYPIPTVRIPVTVAMAIVEFFISIRKKYYFFFFLIPKKVVARVSNEVESHEASMSFVWTLASIKMEKIK